MGSTFLRLHYQSAGNGGLAEIEQSLIAMLIKGKTSAELFALYRLVLVHGIVAATKVTSRQKRGG